MIKVSIMGATGVIGKNVAFKLARTDVIDEIVLFSREKSFNKAKGETYDMYDALSAENVDCDLIPSSDYEDLKDSQVVLITAGVPRKGDMDRLELAKTLPDDVTIHYTVQDPSGKYGTAVPIAMVVEEYNINEI